MVPITAVAAGLKYFQVKGLKGAPKIASDEEFEEMLNIWAEDLEDVDPNIFVAACKSLSNELTFYPAFAEIRQRCDEMVNGKPIPAQEIWSKIKRKMMAVSNPYANPEDRKNALSSIQDEAARKAAEMFDWKSFGLSDESDESYYISQFEKLYNSVRERVKFGNECERLGIESGSGNVIGILDGLVKKIE